MSELIAASFGDFVYHWDWLLGSSVKVTVWLLLVVATFRLLRKASASWRHLLAVGGALGIPVIFLLNVSLIPEQIGWRPFARTMVSPTGVQLLRTTLAEGNHSPVPTGGSPETHERNSIESAVSFDFRSGLVALWWLGCGVVGIRLLLRFRPPGGALLSDVPAELKAALARECARKNLRNAPTLQTAPDAMPFAYGIRRTAIILPTAAIHWPSEKLRAVLRHELAHVQRHDVFWSMVVETALLPVWWHPFARILRRQVLAAAEEACDDAVINTGIVPAQYASDLLSLSPRTMPVSVYGMAALSGRGRADRFKRVLDEDANRAAVTSWKAAGSGLILFGLLVPATLFVSCSTTPKVGDSSARELPVAVPIPHQIRALPGDAKQIRLSVKFFEVVSPSDEELENLGLSDWLEGTTKLLSSAQGAHLFDPSRPGTELLSAPSLVIEPGRPAKIEVVSQVPLSNQEEPELAKVGIDFTSRVWPTGKGDTLKVDVTGSVTEVIGYQSDETGFDVPQLRKLEGDYQGIVKNGSYLLIGRRTQPVVTKDKIPLLGDLPLLGRLFRSSKTGQQKNVIAARLIFSEGP